MSLLPNFGEFFSDVFSGMYNAGYSVMYFFADFGRTFTEPFIESFVRGHFPSLYLIIKPLIDLVETVLTPVLGRTVVQILLGPSLLDMIGIGVVISVFCNVFKKIWDMVPFA